MKTKIFATAEGDTLTEMIVQGDTDMMFAIWIALAVTIGKRKAVDKPLSMALAGMADTLLHEAQDFARLEKEFANESRGLS